jgi:predicted secreted Zn-dependent protease
MRSIGRHGLLPAALLAAACAANPPAGSGVSVGVPPGVRYNQRVESYEVTGTDHAALGRGIRAAPPKAGGGQRFAGYYEWYLSWRYETVREGPVCRVSRVSIVIDSVVTLPKWTPPATADAALVEDWKRFITALATHEAGHRDLVLDGAVRVQRAILGIAPQDCGAMAGAIQQEAQPVLTNLRAEELRYDETTRHGATQGAVWAGGLRPWWDVSRASE